MRRRRLSEDERALWLGATRTVAPLRKPVRAKTAADAEPATVTPPEPAPSMPAVAAATAVRKILPPAPPAPAPLDRRLRRRVARGTVALDGRLDLHGMTQAEAHAALLSFLREAQARGAKIVLVITGKGGRGDELSERGVLKRQVPHWLALAEFHAFVAGFEPAAPVHGGAGALYVRLRRRRAVRAE